MILQSLLVDVMLSHRCQIVKVVLDRFPQYAEYQDKVLVSISDETGPLTPSSFLELFDTFKIVKVTEQ